MVELNVEGMSCGHCAGRVSKAIADVDPAAKVEVDVGSGLVRVTSSAPVQELAQAVSEAGYPASPRA
ncbi:heavy-metal-associated domain-containing protein [Pseudoduganella sp. GCM10020061]|uniref:heavy-metal-associated domain-containing protein n=1 Tax=Pseudoduganella sp. GCM10020061 TaxID=3317345 RepID=UPI00363AA02D